MKIRNHYFSEALNITFQFNLRDFNLLVIFSIIERKKLYNYNLLQKKILTVIRCYKYKNKPHFFTHQTLNTILKVITKKFMLI